MLALIEEHADRIDASAPINPFASAAWLTHYVQTVGRDVDTFGAVDLPGRALMLLQRSARREWHAVANYYTSLYSPVIAAPGDVATAAVALVDRIATTRPRVSALRLAPLAHDAPDTQALAVALRARGWYVHRYFAFGNWHLECEGLAMDDYVAQLPSQARNTLQRKGRKFHASGGRLEIRTAPHEVEAGMRAYEAIYAKSWKQPEPYPAFVSGWAAACARNGWLRLGVAWMNDAPIAVQFWFTRNRRAFIFKLAYDEAHATWSAGTLLTALLMRHSLEVDRVVEIDYLTGDDAYKRTWMRSRRERVGLLACNPRTAHGLMLAAGERAREVLRPWLRRKPPAEAAVAPTAAAPSDS